MALQRLQSLDFYLLAVSAYLNFKDNTSQLKLYSGSHNFTEYKWKFCHLRIEQSHHHHPFELYYHR
jgi:hypothetical protein